MFSSRLPPDLRPNALSRLIEKKRAGGVALLDLTESNPTRVGLPYPEPEILAALANARALRYDPRPAGMRSAREAAAAYYAERGIAADPDDVLLTSGTSEAYALLFKLLCDPGDEVLTPRPSYPLFEHLAALEGVRAGQYALEYSGGWRIDFETLERSITPRTRAIAVVNPNNPTGSFLKRQELAAMDRLCASHGLALLSDEVFADYAAEDDAHRAATVIGAREALTFAMSGLSKVAGLPQMKLGWIVVNGPQDARRAAFERLEWIADTYLSVGAPVQCACGALLRAGASIRDAIARRVERNFAGLRRRFADGSPFRVLAREGGWYTVIEAPRIRTEDEWARELLLQHDTLVQPGYFFDFEREAYLVVSGLARPEEFDAGIERISRLA